MIEPPQRSPQEYARQTIDNIMVAAQQVAQRAVLDKIGTFWIGGRLDAAGIVNLRTPPILIVGDGSTVITTGVKAWWPFDFDFQVEQWTVLGDVSGSIAITLTKATYTAFPTFSPMSGAGAISVTGAQKNRSTPTALTTWTTTRVFADEVVRVNVDSVTTMHKALIWITGRRL